MAYIGVQNRDSEAHIDKDNYSRINSSGANGHNTDETSCRISHTFKRAIAAIEVWLKQSDSTPNIVNRFEVLAGRDIPGAREWVCYWTSKSKSERCLVELNLRGIYESSNPGSGGHIGLWLEVIIPDLIRLETNYNNTDYKPGLAELEGITLEPHGLTGYWGAARDRIQSSAYDNFEDDGERNDAGQNGPQSHSSPSPGPLHLKGQDIHTIAHIRSGQFWENCQAEECEAYEKKLEPHLFDGLADIFARPKDLGDYGLRFLRNLPLTGVNHGATRKETCAAGFSQSLSHLEGWAKDCPSHHKIYGGAINHKIKYGKEAKLRTWHEIAVLKPGEARWEYLNCDEGTGTIAFQQSQAA